jgi:hypothetical protein
VELSRLGEKCGSVQRLRRVTVCTVQLHGTTEFTLLCAQIRWADNCWAHNRRAHNRGAQNR